MEARMKHIRWAALFVAVVAMLLSGVGCEQKSTGDNNQNGGSIGSIQIVTGAINDTLEFLPADSASTTVTIIVSDDNGNVMRDVKVDISLANANLGVIEYVDTDRRDTTDAVGRVNAVFRTFARAGDQIITASAGGRTATRTLFIREQDDAINGLTLVITPKQLEASPSVEDSAQISVTITDAANRGVRNVALTLRASGGRLVIPSVTDSTGKTSTWWYNNRQFGEFTITVQAGSITATDTVTVTEVQDILGTLTIATSEPVIEADGCITAATITASLKNQFGEAVRGDTIRFGAPELGAINTIAITDCLGIAMAQFCGMTIPNDQDPADSSMVVARYEKWGLRDTVNVRIIPAAGIGNVNLGVSNTVGVAGVDSVALNVFVQFANGAPVNGYWVKFRYTPCGDFKYDSLRLVNGSPDSVNYYYLCQAVPQSPVKLVATVDGIPSDTMQVLVIPGQASSVRLDPIPPTTIGVPVQVNAAVVDTFNNPVQAGTSVGFLSTIGAIPAFSSTDADGWARPMLNPGTTAGVGLVKSFLASGGDTSITTLIVQSGNVSTLTGTLVPTSLQAQGSGGQDWAQVSARVYDDNGNPVEDGQWVRFRLTTFPAGTNINGNGILDSAVTAGGLAMATVNAGAAVGPVMVSVCVSVNGQEQCVPVTGSVVAGPPFEIGIGVDEVGEDAGGAAWDVEISALVKDAVQNNVINGTNVFFEVSPPELAQILSESVVVGNENMDGDERPGVAFTTLRYNSMATNSTVTITARTGNGVEANFDFTLPIQEPTINLDALPGSWHFIANGNPCRIQLRAEVRDGHSVLINDQEVYYSSQRGRMFANQQGTGPAISTDFTGPNFGEPDGQCSIFLVDSVGFIFPDPLTPEIPGEVRVEVVGYESATNSQVINFRR